MFGRNIFSLTLGIAVVAAASVPLKAYNISAKGRVHERITRLAEICADLEPAPLRCDLPADVRQFQKVRWREGKLWEAVRWPDDPTQQGNVGGAVKFAINAGLGRCEKYLQPGQPFAGLLCSSHYGHLQFMHAMSSDQAENGAATRALIVAWTKFAFGVASGQTDGAAPFCATVRAAGAPLADALAPDSFPFCDGGKYLAWKVRTLFVLRCRNPFSSVICSEADGAPADERARKNATGALLHLIQDSYSRSHADRGSGEGPLGPYHPVIDCKPVRAFHLYASNKKEHGAADKLPAISSNCLRDGEIFDPVTASAQMLRAVAAMDEDAAVTLIERHVLGQVPSA